MLSLGLACNWQRLAPVFPTPSPTATIETPSPHLTAAAPSGIAVSSPTPTPLMATSVATSPAPDRVMQVCTGWALGLLNVRTCPGVECWVKDFLYEGEVVYVAPTEAVARDGGRWVWIHMPAEGWVNLRYLCPLSPETPPTPGRVPTLDLPPKWLATPTSEGVP